MTLIGWAGADWVGMAATSFVAALLQAANGFGFAVMAVPLFLLFAEPGQAIQLVILVTLALSVVVLPGLHDAVNQKLLARLSIGALAGLPFGLAAFGYADPILVRAAIGVIILAFAAVLTITRWLQRPDLLVMRPCRDIGAGVVSGVATALTGMSGPPVLIYLMLAGAPQRAVRATLLAFFALSYAATLLAHLATIGVPRSVWLGAASLIPFVWAGGLIGRRVGDRMGTTAAAVLAIVVLAATGLYTVAIAGRLALS
jgi:uncharacterized membrane protein YfcA